MCISGRADLADDCHMRGTRLVDATTLLGLVVIELRPRDLAIASVPVQTTPSVVFKSASLHSGCGLVLVHPACIALSKVAREGGPDHISIVGLLVDPTTIGSGRVV